MVNPGSGKAQKFVFFFFFKVEGDLGMFTDGEEASVEEGLKVQNM